MSLDQGWKDTIDAGLKDPSRNVHRPLITAEIAGYNHRLQTTKNYQHVDWKIIEAIVWVESGGPKTKAWNGRAMQIGNLGDPGLNALKQEEGATTLIVTATLLEQIKQSTTKDVNDADFNIKTGIAYLFVRMAQSIEDTIETDPMVHQYVVQTGDSLSAIAKELGSTIASIDKATLERDPQFDRDRIHPGQTVYYRKAHVGRIITGWRTFTASSIAQRYNSETTDKNYAEKLRYVFERL